MPREQMDLELYGPSPRVVAGDGDVEILSSQSRPLTWLRGTPC